MDKMREEFDVWCDEQGYVSDKYISDDCGDRYKHLVGEYVISETRFLWEAWKASRAALYVELPENCKGMALTVSELHQQLDKAGVSYK